MRKDTIVVLERDDSKAKLGSNLEDWWMVITLTELHIIGKVASMRLGFKYVG